MGFLLSPVSEELVSYNFMPVAEAKVKGKSPKGNSKKGPTGKTEKKKGKTVPKKKGGSKISVVYTDTLTGEWIHRGNKSIVIHRDANGKVRAMSPFRTSPTVGKRYAEALNRYAEALKERGTKVYSLIAPSQGEFYMPPQITDNVSQDEVIRKVAQYFNYDVTPIFVADNLRKHVDEGIYNSTDHHWAPLGAFYAAEVLARELNVPFVPLDKYSTDSIRNYVGSMYNFSGDPAVKNNPELFVYFMPPGYYYSEFIDYKVVNQETKSESKKHEAPFFKKYPDGSGLAYCTFMGGDRYTVRIVNRNDNSGRKLLIVKDSFGNAVAPCLINSFDEVHVIDFRYFPHNLLDYVADNDITDLVFINCPSIALAQNTANRFNKMMSLDESGSVAEVDDEEAEEEVITTQTEDNGNNY